MTTEAEQRIKAETEKTMQMRCAQEIPERAFEAGYAVAGYIKSTSERFISDAGCAQLAADFLADWYGYTDDAARGLFVGSVECAIRRRMRQ